MKLEVRGYLQTQMYSDKEYRWQVEATNAIFQAVHESDTIQQLEEKIEFFNIGLGGKIRAHFDYPEKGAALHVLRFKEHNHENGLEIIALQY